MCVSIFLVMLHTMVVRVRRPIGFRPPPDQIPSAARSDSVRRPVGYLETQPAKYRAFALILLNI